MVKASAALKDAQRKLAELRLSSIRCASDLAARGGNAVGGSGAFGRMLFQFFPRGRAPRPAASQRRRSSDLEKVDEDMLREIALKGQVPLPAASSDAELDAE